MRTSNLIFAALTTSLSAAACSSAGGTLDEALDFGGEQVGIFDTDGGRHGIALHVGSAHHDSLLASLAPHVRLAAQDEAHLKIHIVLTGNAAESIVVALPRSGELRLDGQNDAARSDSVERIVDETLGEVTRLLPPATPAGQAEPADLFGELDELAGWVSAGTETEPRRVLLITGGGIHRSTDLDAVDALVEPATVPTLAAPGIDIELIGIARFEGQDTGVTTEFTVHIEGMWRSWCDKAISASCSVNGER